MWFANDFHSWLRPSWKLLANHLTRDQKSLFMVTHALSFMYFCIRIPAYMCVSGLCHRWFEKWLADYSNPLHVQYKMLLWYMVSSQNVNFNQISHKRYINETMSDDIVAAQSDFAVFPVRWWSNLEAVKYRIHVRNSSSTQISRHLVCP